MASTLDRFQAGLQVLADEHVVAAVRRSCPSFRSCTWKVGGCGSPGCRALPGVEEFRRVLEKRFEKARTQRILRRHVEVAADDAARRAGERAGTALRRLSRAGLRCTSTMEFPQPLDLRGAMAARVVLEVRAGDAQRAERRVHRSPRPRARHARRAGSRPGQRMPQHASDRQARSDQVAECSPFRPRGRDIYGSGVEKRIAGKLAAEHGDLVLAAAAGQVGEAGADLLQAHDVGIGSAALRERCARDRRPVEPAAPLHVPAEQPHAAILTGRQRLALHVGQELEQHEKLGLGHRLGAVEPAQERARRRANMSRRRASLPMRRAPVRSART